MDSFLSATHEHHQAKPPASTGPAGGSSGRPGSVVQPFNLMSDLHGSADQHLK